MLSMLFMILSMLLLPAVCKNFMTAMILPLIILIIPLMVKTLSVPAYFFTYCIFAMDTMSLTLMILTIWVIVMMVLASMKIFTDNKQPKTFMYMMTILLLVLLNCFSTANLMIFYIWFEASLIPTMMLIVLWGYQPERSQASMYLMIYTVTASLPMLTMLCKLVTTSKTNSMPMFSNFMFPADLPLQWLAWIILIGGFLVKLPMFTVHLWLPKAHVEAPVAGSMILAAILLKLGGYGIMRMVTLFNPMVMKSCNFLMSLTLIGAVVTSMICMRQTDLKSLIAYSSVGHMGLMLAGAMANTQWGLQASLAMMIAHGLSSSALFAMVNMNYEINQTRSTFLTKGLMTLFPTLTLWWFLFTAMNMAAPPSINLLSEIMLITSVLSSSITSAILLGMISFFTVAYSLFMYTTMHHGQTLSSYNPLPAPKMSNYTLMFMHLIPALLLITKPEMITNWA